MKGVVDYADLSKDDNHHDIALSSSITFLGWVLPKAVKRMFGRSNMLKVHKDELAQAVLAFQDGDFTIFRDESMREDLNSEG